MANTENYFRKSSIFVMNHLTNLERKYTFCEYHHENCLPRNNVPHSISIRIDFPVQLLRTLLRLMDISTSVKISKNLDGKEMMLVSDPYYTALHIESAIKYAIKTTMYHELSVSDANAIIQRLELSQHVYCIEGHESGACLVVFEKKLHRDGIDAEEVFRKMVNGLQTSGRSSTETIQSRIQKQLQLQAIEDQVKRLNKIK